MSKKYIIIIIIFISICFIFMIKSNSYDIEKTFVNGNSMNPEFVHLEKICLYKDFYNKNKIKNGDIIGFELKTKGNFIKRVIAIPGDEVIFGRDGFIYINNIKQEEKYIKTTQKFNKNNIKTLLTQLEYYKNIVPSHMIIVMGDNRFDSIDSSLYGMIDFEQILGKVFKSKNGYCF